MAGPPQTPRHRVAVADDHASFAEALGIALGSRPGLAFVGAAYSVAGAIRLVAERSPDILILDRGLPDGDGIEAIPRLLRAGNNLHIVVLTAHVDPDAMARAASLGCAGFLRKESGIDTILAAIQTAAEGGMVVDPQLFAALAEASATKETDRTDSLTELLTPREREVLALLVKGLDSKTIAVNLGLKLSTTRSYLKTIFAKLGVHTRLEAVLKAVRAGYSIDNVPPTTN